MESLFLKVYAHQEILIGRDANRWWLLEIRDPAFLLTIASQHVVHDAVVSFKHLRIYTIIFDENQSEGIAPLVYAQDLSRNGTYWNGSLIGKGIGAVLLSEGDTLRISPRRYYHFHQRVTQNEGQPFDLTQECEMKHFEKKYSVSDRKLGSGACGEVFMAIDQTQHIQLACKIVDLRRLRSPPQTKVGRLEGAVDDKQVDSRVQMVNIKSWGEKKEKANQLEQQLRVHHREATILASLSHPNIIGIEKVYITDNSIYIFQDLVTGGDLFSFLERKNGKLSDVEAAVIVRQILMALEYLHDQNIVHRDLKPENILMTSSANGCQVVLTDFGHAKKIDNDRTRMTTMAGTEQYVAPEIVGHSRHFRGKNGYTKAIDMWSLGCITVALLTGASPFMSQKTNQYCQKLAQNCDLHQLDQVPEWQYLGKRPKDFAKRLLILDEERRMTAKVAKNHWWFSNDLHKVDFEEVYDRATKHWRPRTPKTPVIEMIDVEKLMELPLLQKGDILGQRNNRRINLVPIDPPYKPYPRRMSLSLLPKRRPTLSGCISDEVRTAIHQTWSPEKMRVKASESENKEIPALIPDAEENEVNPPQDAKEAQKKIALHIHRPSFTSLSEPLVHKSPSIAYELMTSSNTPSKDSVAKARATKFAGSTDHPNVFSAVRETGQECGHAGRTKSPLAPNRLAAEEEDILSAVETDKNGQRFHDGGAVIDATMTNEKVVCNRRRGGMAAEKSSSISVYQPSDRGNESATEQALETADGKRISPASASSLPEEPMFHNTLLERPLVRADLETLRSKNATLKLRSPSRSHLGTKSQRPSNMKKRRGSIYDIDPDGESAQAQCNPSTLTPDPDRVTLWPRVVRKKARIQPQEQQ